MLGEQHFLCSSSIRYCYVTCFCLEVVVICLGLVCGVLETQTFYILVILASNYSSKQQTGFDGFVGFSDEICVGLLVLVVVVVVVVFSTCCITCIAPKL